MAGYEEQLLERRTDLVAGWRFDETQLRLRLNLSTLVTRMSTGKPKTVLFLFMARIVAKTCRRRFGQSQQVQAGQISQQQKIAETNVAVATTGRFRDGLFHGGER